MKRMMLIMVAALPMFAGCRGGDEDESTRLLLEAGRRISELESLLAAERESYIEDYAELSQKFEAEQQANAAKLKLLNQRILEMKEQVRELNRAAVALQGYVTTLQQRLDAVRAVEQATEVAPTDDRTQ